MDELLLEGLELSCRVGCTEFERSMPQALRADVRLRTPTMREAALRDDLAFAVDYRVANDMVLAAAEGEFLLLERVAERLAEVALRDPNVDEVELTLRKRPPVQSLAWAGVRIVRRRGGSSG